MTTRDTHSDLPAGDTETTPVLMLSVHNAKDRELIQKFLPDGLDIEVSMNGIAHRPFDLCIMDHKSFHANKHSLQQLKDEAAPIFLPFLLLSQNQDSVRKSEQILEFADDVVYVPASTKLLQSRINMLLKQREYSLKLEEKNRQLEQKNHQLAEEKRKYQLITENATDMISRHQPDGTYLYVSPASKELIGYEPEELVGKNAYDSMHPEDRERITSENDAQFADKSVVRWTFRKLTKEQGYKWVEATMRPIRDESGEVTEIQASTRDISARKEYERKLKEEKEFIDKSIASLPELFFLLDEDQNFVRWNNVERELGYSDEEVSNMHPLEFYQEKDQPFIISKIRQAFEEGSAEAEVEMLAKSGELIPFFVTAKHFKRGDEHYIVGSCINLSDIKEAQYELEQHRQLLDAIINQTKSLIYLKDEDRKYRLVNESYLEFYGLEREDVIGKTDLEVHGREFEERAGQTDLKVLKNRRTEEVEEARRGIAETRLFHTIKYPLQGVQGFENCMCGISTDITDLKMATNQLQKRIREQRCLYNISNIDDYENSIEELVQETLSLIPEGFRYPEIAEAAISYGGTVFKTDGYQESDSRIIVENDHVHNTPLSLEVVYTKFKGEFNEQVFLDEERKLINSIVDTLVSKIDRNLTQQKLRESRNRWEQLVEKNPSMVQLTDADGIIKYVNPAGAKLYGVENPEELIGQPFRGLLTFEEESLMRERMAKIFKGASLPQTTYKVTTHDGREKFIELRSVGVKHEEEDVILTVAQDITERFEYKNKLEISLKEKETLLQEIHHRVKNNLAVVSGMMELQTFNTENEEVRSLLSDSKNRIKTMALIHEKLYQSESLSEIDFGSYIRDLAGSIAKMSPSAEDIDLEFDCDAFSLNINQAVPTALIINEIMSNAYEHAFGENEDGKINISMKQDQRQITVRISDNGKGLPTDLEFKKGESIGFTIIETLVMQLEADLDITNENGLAISFSFEKQDIKGSASTLI